MKTDFFIPGGEGNKIRTSPERRPGASQMVDALNGRLASTRA